MLNWLKSKSQLQFLNHYINLALGTDPADSSMFITDQRMLNDSQLDNALTKIFVHNEDGCVFSFEAPCDMRISCLKALVVHHFHSNSSSASNEVDCSSTVEESGTNCGGKNYHLILAREVRRLVDENSIGCENLQNNDEILLIESKTPDVDPIIPTFDFENTINFLPENSVPSSEQIELETALLSAPVSRIPSIASSTCSYDFKIALRQILLTMIEASICIIAPEPNAPELFQMVFEHLEKRHKPRIDKALLQQLTDMGFPEKRAIKALHLKKTLVEATEWLLQESHEQNLDFDADDESDSRCSNSNEFWSDPLHHDSAQSLLKGFHKYMEKWFVPEVKALQNLVGYGYGSDLAKEALRITCNSETHAKEFLEGNSTQLENCRKGFERDSPIMSAILDSTIVQVALAKPKTLFALMVLCETPSNVNVWLSDPETHPVVSQILRIYHAEKHRLVDIQDGHNVTENNCPTPCNVTQDSVPCNATENNCPTSSGDTQDSVPCVVTEINCPTSSSVTQDSVPCSATENNCPTFAGDTQDSVPYNATENKCPTSAGDNDNLTGGNGSTLCSLTENNRSVPCTSTTIQQNRSLPFRTVDNNSSISSLEAFTDTNTEHARTAINSSRSLNRQGNHSFNSRGTQQSTFDPSISNQGDIIFMEEFPQTQELTLDISNDSLDIGYSAVESSNDVEMSDSNAYDVTIGGNHFFP